MDINDQRKSMRQSIGNIKFLSVDLRNVEKVDDDFQERKLSSTSKSSSRLLAVPQLETCSSAQSSVGNSHEIKDWINQKSLTILRDQHSAETSRIRQRYNRVLCNEGNFVKGVEEFLKEEELLKLRKKELLHKKWHERVYTPLRKEILSSLKNGYDCIHDIRRKEYSKYLRYTRRKGFVFLDVISKGDYNPFNLYSPASPLNLCARTTRLDDPLLMSDRQRLDEEKIILRCETGKNLPNSEILSRRLPRQPLVPLGREETKGTTWLSMTLRSMDSPDRSRSRQRMGGKSTQTDIDFATWSSANFEPEITDREFRIQKKRRFRLPLTVDAQDTALPDKSGVRFANPPVTSTA